VAGKGGSGAGLETPAPAAAETAGATPSPSLASGTASLALSLELAAPLPLPGPEPAERGDNAAACAMWLPAPQLAADRAPTAMESIETCAVAEAAVSVAVADAALLVSVSEPAASRAIAQARKLAAIGAAAALEEPRTRPPNESPAASPVPARMRSPLDPTPWCGGRDSTVSAEPTCWGPARAVSEAVGGGFAVSAREGPLCSPPEVEGGLGLIDARSPAFARAAEPRGVR
jgi:hypothetical protein